MVSNRAGWLSGTSDAHEGRAASSGHSRAGFLTCSIRCRCGDLHIASSVGRKAAPTYGNTFRVYLLQDDLRFR